MKDHNSTPCVKQFFIGWAAGLATGIGFGILLAIEILKGEE